MDCPLFKLGSVVRPQFSADLIFLCELHYLESVGEFE
jgi:hypothetical protein